MAKKRYNGLSASQKAELWQRWKDGQSLSEIGSALNKHPASVYTIVACQWRDCAGPTMSLAICIEAGGA